MKVIATPYVKDIAEQIRFYDVGVVLNKLSIESLVEYVKTKYVYMGDLEKRQALIDSVCFENRLKEFIKLNFKTKS